MATEIITSLIVACGSIICQLIINVSNRKKQESENEKTKSLIVYRIDKLEQKQDKYNHLQERVFNLEKNYKLEIVGKMCRRKSSKNRCSNCNFGYRCICSVKRCELGCGRLGKCTFGSSFAVDKCCRFAGNIRRIRIHKISTLTTVFAVIFKNNKPH